MTPPVFSPLKIIGLGFWPYVQSSDLSTPTYGDITGTRLLQSPPGVPLAQPQVIPSLRLPTPQRCSRNASQHISLSYAYKTINPDASSECKVCREEPKVNKPPIVRKLAPQEFYGSIRKPTNFRSSYTIEFRVDGQEGIRLSDASEDNWVGLEGRDDRLLFEGDYLQMIIRLHVRYSVSVHQLCRLICLPARWLFTLVIEGGT